MVISVRVSPEREEIYKRYAAEHGMTVSEFMRKCADDVVDEAQKILDEAEEERKHAEEVVDFMRRFEEFKKHRDSVPLKEYTEDELFQMRLERFGLTEYVS